MLYLTKENRKVTGKKQIMCTFKKLIDLVILFSVCKSKNENILQLCSKDISHLDIYSTKLLTIRLPKVLDFINACPIKRTISNDKLEPMRSIFNICNQPLQDGLSFRLMHGR